MQSINDSLLLFIANDTTGNPCLWVTDGSEANTTILRKDGNHFSNFYAWQNKLYFSHAGNDKGEELWVTDGSSAGTTMVKDINPDNGNSSPSSFTPLGPGGLYLRQQILLPEMNCGKQMVQLLIQH